ncbi:YbfB/YjiJ family MFS transporter [Streptomyces litchfieldiae]|uniref:YbfB/YjiJ family MFS transporter n=1 Tax=Streptomyces litchfieldiae TaxID=3075543 RepID=A0ABU2MY00_9ACTN|nr:YbfB/YjiJ family MFS transporter [Streptomyces sp. DSM 44938]MDT0345429.1 YbfB/YjiJ family MFS transporter [Streptomyces sp. DSM 44938]
MKREWQIGIAGLTAIGVGFGFARYGYGLFLPEFRAEFGLSVTAVGLIGSATAAGYLVALLSAGVLVARRGPRPVVVAGGVAATAGMALVAVATAPVPLAIGLVLAGTSSGLVWTPFSDVVDRLVPRGSRERVTGAIASGTAFAVVVAGPFALLANATGWRFAWLVFAATALVTTWYNARVLPGGRGPARARAAGGPRSFARAAAVPLYLTALVYGVAGAVYWTFAMEAIEGGGAVEPLFWTLMGAAGTAGVLTGHAIVRLGVRRVQIGLFTGIAAALALLGAAPGAMPAVVASALLYGPCFMAGSGVLAVWSHQVFPERPSAGFTATVLFLGVGSVAGPAALGAFGDRYGLGAAFLVTAALTQLAPLARPTRAGARARGGRIPPRGMVHGAAVTGDLR